MSRVQSCLKRTVAALVVGLNTNARVSTSPALVTTSLLIGVDGLRSSSSTTKRGLSRYGENGTTSNAAGGGHNTRNRPVLFSTFAVPEPPQSKGLHVFQDIDYSVSTGPTSPVQYRRANPDAVFVVNGASRGIGLQFVKTLLANTAGRVVACCRTPGTAKGLQDLIASSSEDNKNRLSVIAVDMEDQASVTQAGEEIRRQFDRVDLLLNVAGILGDGVSTPGPERSISKIERGWIEKTFQVNVIGPVMFSQELIPLMSQKRRKNPTKDVVVGGSNLVTERPNAVIANLSARVGSISDNGLGGWYSYRMSKAALNQATRTLAHEVKRQSIWCVALHPGTTDTDLSKPFQKNVQEGRLFPVAFTVESLLKVVDSMQDENSGGLYDWAGKAIPF
jgi:NAD(P)-dependent dehydrogenase (short-subunit alcohol dehydrogenase family)